MANYTGTEAKQPYRGSDSTETDKKRAFRGSAHHPCGPVLTSKLVKTLKTHSKIPGTPFLQSP